MHNSIINHTFIKGQLVTEPSPQDRQRQQIMDSMSREIIAGISEHFTRQRVGKIILNTIINGGHTNG